VYNTTINTQYNNITTANY